MANTPRDKKTEDWLTSRGVVFHPPKFIPLTAVDEAESLRNQARHKPLDSETVDRYALAYKDGKELPPTVVYRKGKNLVNIDGNHRYAGAKKAGEKALPMYEIDAATPFEVILLLTVEANTSNGMAVELGWRQRQAVMLVNLGHTQEIAATAAGLTVQTVSTAVRADRAAQRAARLGIRGFDDLANEAKARLGAVNRDVVFQAAAALATETAMTITDVVSLTREIRSAESDDDALTTIGIISEQRRTEAAMKRAAEKGIRITNSPKMRITTALGQVNALDASKIRGAFKTDAEKQEILRRIADAAIKLMELEEELRQDMKPIQATA